MPAQKTSSQNSCRTREEARATLIEVTIEKLNGEKAKRKHRVRVRDNGSGIEEPKVLLSFGESGWAKKTRERERAAGMGLYSLAQRGCEVKSRTSGDSQGWKVVLDEDAFVGKCEVDVMSDPDSITNHGTEVSFIAEESEGEIKTRAEMSARLAPIENENQRLNNATRGTPEESFPYRNVERDRNWSLRSTRMATRPNGELLTEGRSRQISQKSADWKEARGTPAINIIDCPDLQLVLPARKEIVENGFFKTLREQAKTVIYRGIATHCTQAQLTYTQYEEALSLGINMHEAPATLSRWEPLEAWRGWKDKQSEKIDVTPETIIMPENIESHDRFVIERALERCEMNEHVVVAAPFEGFEWV